jgi:hypothetical protein
MIMQAATFSRRLRTSSLVLCSPRSSSLKGISDVVKDFQARS